MGTTGGTTIRGWMADRNPHARRRMLGLAPYELAEALGVTHQPDLGLASLAVRRSVGCAYKPVLL